MSGLVSPQERGRELVDLAVVRRAALTVAQRARREEVARRSALIQAGVRQPASGVFGAPVKPKRG